MNLGAGWLQAGVGWPQRVKGDYLLCGLSCSKLAQDSVHIGAGGP